MRTRWRFGSKRRFVATIECERWFPNAGFLPQIAQTLLIAGGSVANRFRRASGAGARAEPGEQVGHLERRADGVGRAVDARFRLLDGVDGEDAEGHGDARLDARELEAGGRLRCDVLEV